MKKLTLLVALLLPLLIFAQDDPAYVMYRNIKFTPKTGMMNEFSSAMGAHNKKFHSGQQPFHANVWQAIAGVDLGSVIYSMGPMTFEDMDNREVQEGHDEDWAKVLALTESVEDQGFWQLDPEISTTFGPDNNKSKLRIRLIDVKSGEWYRFENCMKQVAQVYADKGYDMGHWVFERRLGHNDDRDAAAVFGYNNWAEMDKGLAGDFDEVHGEGAWDDFLEEIEGSIVDYEDILWVLDPDMSGDNE